MQYQLGTTGYFNPGWANTFYPEGVAKSRWLNYYSSQYSAIELNNTFHKPPSVETVRRWLSRVGGDFRFALKTPRLITHELPFAEAAVAMDEFVATVRELGPQLGPILLQFPPELAVAQYDAVAEFLSSLPKGVRYAVEFRSPGWYRDDVFGLLRDHAICLVAADLEEHPESSAIIPTADFLYLRLLGRHGRFPDETHERFDPTESLVAWQTKIHAVSTQSGFRECWVLFNNDYAGHAPATARRFAKLAGLEGPGVPVKQRKLFDL